MLRVRYTSKLGGKQLCTLAAIVGGGWVGCGVIVARWYKTFRSSVSESLGYLTSLILFRLHRSDINKCARFSSKIHVAYNMLRACARARVCDMYTLSHILNGISIQTIHKPAVTL